MQRSALVSLLFVLGLAGNGAAQSPTWKAEWLGTSPADWSLVPAGALNDSGVVIGNTYVSGYKRGWIASPDLALQLLPVPAGATYTQAYDLNAAGVVAGSVLLSDGTSRGVLWEPGPSGYDVLFLPAGLGGHVPFDARGINDAGDVVGNAAQATPFGFGSGLICFGGQTHRYVGGAASSMGTMTLEDPVAQAGGLLEPGATYHFQTWHRDDPALVPCQTSSNLSNACAVTLTL